MLTSNLDNLANNNEARAVGRTDFHVEKASALALAPLIRVCLSRVASERHADAHGLCNAQLGHSKHELVVEALPAIWMQQLP